MAKDVVDFATKLGRRLSVDYVAVAGLVPGPSHAELVGFLVDVRGGKLARNQALVVNPDVISTVRIRQMASFLADVKYEGPTEEDPGPALATNVVGDLHVGEVPQHDHGHQRDPDDDGEHGPDRAWRLPSVPADADNPEVYGIPG